MYAEEESAGYLGRSSCASATCHGGIVDRGPAWHSSLNAWEAYDATHSGAGDVLFNQQSREIISRLLKPVNALPLASSAGLNADLDKLSDDAVQAALQERCVSCHAPLAIAAPLSWQQAIHEGVSCEACHGPASRWLKLHTFTGPTSDDSAKRGKFATRSWKDRTENCVRCHVGSRSADGLVRDMNHEMIAAGHPALWFDMSQYQMALPPHWQVDPSKSVIKNSRQYECATPAEHFAAKQQTLMAVIKLSFERQQANISHYGVIPELAEYDCFACHQSLEPTRRSRSGSVGIAWNGFYTSQRVLDAFPLGGAEFTTRLQQLLEATHQQHVLSLPAALRRAVEEPIGLQSTTNGPFAMNWLTTNELMLFHASSRSVGQHTAHELMSNEEASELAALLDRYRSHLNAATTQSKGQPLNGLLSSELRDDGKKSLMQLREEYKNRVLTIVGRATSLPQAGVKP